jgi:hypothetical protein
MAHSQYCGESKAGVIIVCLHQVSARLDGIALLSISFQFLLLLCPCDWSTMFSVLGEQAAIIENSNDSISTVGRLPSDIFTKKARSAS